MTFRLVNADEPALARSVLGAPGLAEAKNVFTGKQEVNGGAFTNSFDTALWVAPSIRNNPTLQSQGLWIQHRVMGDLGAKVHDAGAAELRLTGASNTGIGQNAFEASLVCTGGVNDMGNISGVVANFHTSGTPTGNVDRVSLLEATQVPPLAAGFTIDTVCGLRLEQQLVGTTNYTIYAPDGNTALGPLVPKNSTATAVIARSRSDTVADTPMLLVQNSSPTNLFTVTSSGTGGIGGAISGATWWVNNNLTSAAFVALRVRGHSGQTANLVQFGDSGGTAHVFVSAATTSKRANLVMGAAVATTATDGFLYLSTAPGAPTGSPTAFAGTAPMVVDSANHRAYVNDGSWRYVELTADGSVKVPSTGAFSSFNTSDEATNYERARGYWSSGFFTLATEAGGTGTVRPITVNGASSYITLASTGIQMGRGGTSAVSIVTQTATLTANGANQALSVLTPTVSQSGSAGYTALQINVTESSTGSGSKNLIDAQVGGVSKFRADNAGKVTLNNGPMLIPGTGSPEGAVSAPVGSVFLRGDGGAATTFYVKESGTGNTGWVAK